MSGVSDVSAEDVGVRLRGLPPTAQFLAGLHSMSDYISVYNRSF